MAIKLETRIKQDLTNVVQAGLAARGYGNFSVKYGFIPQEIAAENLEVWLQKTGETFAGSQFRYDFTDRDTGLLKHEEGYFVDFGFRAGLVWAQNLENMGTNAETACDAAQALCAYLMSADGLKALKNMGYGIAPIKNILQSYAPVTGQNGRTAVLPVFDFIISLKQSYSGPIPEIADRTFTTISV